MEVHPSKSRVDTQEVGLDSFLPACSNTSGGEVMSREMKIVVALYLLYCAGAFGFLLLLSKLVGV